jgi:serine/threonine protein kinase
MGMLTQMAAQLLVALVHIHANGFVHGDLKSENVAVVRENNEYRIKLIDYDLSARSELVRAHAGTRLTISPEVVGGSVGPLFEAADWWSYGMTLQWWASQMLQGLASRRRDNGELQKWRKWLPESWNRNSEDFQLDIPSQSHQLPQKLCCFLMNFFTDNPRLRRFSSKADIEKLMKHNFFENVDWNSIVRPRLQKGFFDDSSSSSSENQSVPHSRTVDNFRGNAEIRDE